MADQDHMTTIAYDISSPNALDDNWNSVHHHSYNHNHHISHHNNTHRNAPNCPNPLIKCANCGGLGHVYRTCLHPITSYGIICFRQHLGRLEYLMIQRRHSLSYVEFMRGKYQNGNGPYLMTLFRNMTQEERGNIDTSSFDQLWHDLWHPEHGRSYQREYVDAKSKFDRLKQGGRRVTLGSLLENTESPFTETEWGFPKGRRNINENDYGCALREFREETGIPTKHLYLIRDMDPFEEIFTGLNGVRYRHVYFAACFNDNVERMVGVNPANATQVREVRAVSWFDYDAAQSKIRTQHVERKELFKRANALISRVYGSFNRDHCNSDVASWRRPMPEESACNACHTCISLDEKMPV